MFLTGILSWWYKKGWVDYVGKIKMRLKVSSDFFSIGLLLKTLAAPYRQISANDDPQGLAEHLQASIDRLFSRTIGFIVRSFTVIFGIIVLICQSIISLLVLIFWFIIPTFPIIGLIIMILGWVPSWI